MAFIHSWLAAAKLGVIYVPINTDYKGDILQYQLNKADVTHLVIDSNLVERISEIFDQLPLLKVVIVHADSDESTLRYRRSGQ